MSFAYVWGHMWSPDLHNVVVSHQKGKTVPTTKISVYPLKPLITLTKILLTIDYGGTSFVNAQGPKFYCSVMILLKRRVCGCYRESLSQNIPQTAEELGGGEINRVLKHVP